MKIVFWGDSITDMVRYRDHDAQGRPWGFGAGYVFMVSTKLMSEKYGYYTILNRGVGGSRIVDLYSRIKCDVWNETPDLLSILIGVNDVWHDLVENPNGVDIERWEKVYRMIIEDTKKVLPNIKIMICEPFVLRGTATEANGNFECFEKVREYASVAKKLAQEYNLGFVALQEKFDDLAAKYGAEHFLYDGVHPDLAGSNLIAEEWLNVFKNHMTHKAN